MALTQQQLDFFHQNGYLSYGPILKPEELDPIRTEYDRLFAEAEQDGRYRNLTMNDGGTVEEKKAAPQRMLQIMQMCERSLVFRRLLYDARLLDIVQDILGPNLMLFHDQALFKPAHHGGAVFWHQDNAYWKCRPANLVSVWIALDDAVRENGAMQVIPGSHLTPAGHDPAKPGGPLIQTKVDESKAVVVELPAGGCMFHHCQTLHYTQPNATPRQRRAFIMHYMNPGTRGHGGEVIHVGFGNPVLRMGV